MWPRRTTARPRALNAFGGAAYEDGAACRDCSGFGVGGIDEGIGVVVDGWGEVQLRVEQALGWGFAT